LIRDIATTFFRKGKKKQKTRKQETDEDQLSQDNQKPRETLSNYSKHDREIIEEIQSIISPHLSDDERKKLDIDTNYKKNNTSYDALYT
jgi:uncharacterized protein YeeX (DUF496 family)